MSNEVEIQLDNDPLGRQLKLTRDLDGYNNESNYPCNTCLHGIFNVDHWCCRKLPHGWDEWDQFKGTDVYPFEEINRKAREVLGRPVDYPKEDVIFYGCNAKNS
ncbi:hypothetical protein [Vibrio parahaemolyticus]|uniref:hypothetical protein n=1 Tax=Vibrio parahaemolyticus TaxID=670 RepID=UPI0024AFD443|nr:hypothetical protein [Vibrio parahaemolyticus]MDI7855102.1 hypothetical protein [Vibrio parahaemolyticus]